MNHTLSIAYAPSEAPLYERLRLHLEPLCQAGLLRVLPLQQSRAEAIARTCVEVQLGYTELYVPLLSPEFVASSARRWQLELAMQRARAGELLILPILARGVDVEATPLSGLTAVGGEGGLLERSVGLDEALSGLARAIRRGFEPEPRTQTHDAPAGQAARRVLCLFADPRGWPPLRVGAEQAAIQREVAGSDALEVRCLPATSFSDVHTALLERDYDMVHFSGHHEPSCGLMFADRGGDPERVVADAFVRLLKRRPSIRAIVFNACHSLEIGRRCAARMDHVVAFSGALEDQVAIEFSTFFYRALASGLELSQAFADGACVVEGKSSTGASAHLLGTSAPSCRGARRGRRWRSRAARSRLRAAWTLEPPAPGLAFA